MSEIEELEATLGKYAVVGKSCYIDLIYEAAQAHLRYLKHEKPLIDQILAARGKAIDKNDLVSRDGLIKEFERLKQGVSVRDEVYLSGCIAVINTYDTTEIEPANAAEQLRKVRDE